MALTHWPKSLPVDQDRTEVRILSVVLTLFFAEHLIEPAMYATFVHESRTQWVISLTGAPNAARILLFLWVVLVVPHFISLIAFPQFLHLKWPRRFACAGASGAALTWFYFANLAWPLDAGVLPWMYAIRAVWDLFVAAVLAFSLNSQLLRPLIHAIE